MTRAPQKRGDGRPDEVRIPVSQIAVRSPRLDALVDPTMARIRPIAGLDHAAIERTVSMATMVRETNGGPLRTFSGGLAHENGWHPSFKARRLLHWQGEAQLQFITKADLDHDVVHLGTECMRLEFAIDGALVSYTIDVELLGADGTIQAIEIKRDERDLEDEDYRLKLAYVREILRRCDIDFRVVLRDEIFRNRRHLRNVEDFASRRLRSVDDDVMARFERHAALHGSSTFGMLASTLHPESSIQGRATVQALVARRRVRIDLTRRIDDDTPVELVRMDKARRRRSDRNGSGLRSPSAFG
jgi:hypothetical protein